MKINTACAAFFLMVCVTAPTRAYAQAYCALRDPVHQVYRMFPDATSYRSIVRTVDNRAREEVATRLPFELHYNELGRHTLYVPVQGDVPLGIIHVRSEASEWGLVEIAWAFDVDLRIIGFRFQRCRDPKRETVESGAFLMQIKGKGFAQLRAMFLEDGGTGDSDGLKTQHEAEELVAVTLRSALKTMVITEAVWGQDLRTIRLLARGRAAFPDAAKVQLIENPYVESVVDELRRQPGSAASNFDRRTVDLLRLTDPYDSTMGFTVRTDWKPAGDPCVLWWSVSRDGMILGVNVGRGTIDRKVKPALNSLVGATIGRLQGCATAVELAALEVLIVCQQHGNTR